MNLQPQRLSTYVESLDQDSKIATLGTLARSVQGIILSSVRAHLRAEAAHQAEVPTIDLRNEQDEEDRLNEAGQTFDDIRNAGQGQEAGEPPMKRAARFFSVHADLVQQLDAYPLTDYQKPQSFEAMLDNMIAKPRAQTLDEAVVAEYEKRGITGDRIAIMKDNQAKQSAYFLSQDKNSIMALYNCLEADSGYTLDDLPSEEKMDLCSRAAKSLKAQANFAYTRANKVEHFVTGDLLMATAGQLEKAANSVIGQRVVRATQPAAATA